MARSKSRNVAAISPAAAHPRSKPPGGKRRGVAEVKTRTELVEQFMSYGAPRAAIRAALERNGLPMPERTLDEYMRRVREQWAREDDDQRPTRRARQLLRLYAQVRVLTEAKRHRDVLERERLIAQIEGNLAPLKVESTVRRRGWDDLSEADLEYIRKNDGKLPPGVTAEELDRPN